nr:outer membrane lipoprotein carrier protein LolA [Photobacterium aphoticum]
MRLLNLIPTRLFASVLVACVLAGVPMGNAYAQAESQNLSQNLSQTASQAMVQAESQTDSQTLSLADLQQRLAAQTLVRGDFVQTRHMAMFNAPLVSSGHFLLAQDQGLQWQQTVPFPVSLILTQDKLSQQFADSPAQVVDAKDNPMVFYFSHLFLSLFEGNTQQLTEQFTVSLTTPNAKEQADGARWVLTLTPTAAPLNAVFEHIRLSGDQFIDQLILTEKRGDVTEIAFSHQTTIPATLSKEEQRAFQL